jgi:FtsH-binding integral membrane protein
MPRWFAHFLIIVGWLLTPAWAWAASHLGLWVGALVALRLQSPIAMLAIAGAGALVFGFAVLWTWVRFMRRLPHLLSHHMAPRASEEHAAIAAAD